MVSTHPMAIDMANKYVEHIPRRSGRHEKKAVGLPPTCNDTNESCKDIKISNILSSSYDNSNRSSTIQAHVVHKVTLVSSSNFTEIIMRAKSTPVKTHKYVAKKQRQPYRLVFLKQA